MTSRTPLFFVMFAAAAMLAGCGGDDAVKGKLQDYMDRFPESQLCDVYKYCFQDYFGPEHLVSDSAAMADYILAEIANADSSDWEQPLFAYPVGLEGNFIRVDIGYVRQGIITVGDLAMAFVESSKGWLDSGDRTLDEWKQQWETIQATLRQVSPQPKNFEEDSALIANALASGQYAFHHSRLFNSTYHQHYRIIRRDLWEKLKVEN